MLNFYGKTFTSRLLIGTAMLEATQFLTQATPPHVAKTQ